MPRSAAMRWIASAIVRAWASDSMMQGPAIRKSWPAPTWTGPISKELLTDSIVMAPGVVNLFHRSFPAIRNFPDVLTRFSRQPTMKDIYIADLANFDEGKLFDGFFLVLLKQQRTTKTNKPYLNVILGDKTGQLEGRVWEPGDPRIAREFERGDIVKVRGSFSRYNDRPQVKVDQLREAVEGEVEKSDLLPSTIYDVAALWSQLLGYVGSLTNPDLKLLL